jgi:hypothetical protein
LVAVDLLERSHQAQLLLYHAELGFPLPDLAPRREQRRSTACRGANAPSPASVEEPFSAAVCDGMTRNACRSQRSVVIAAADARPAALTRVFDLRSRDE